MIVAGTGVLFAAADRDDPDHGTARPAVGLSAGAATRYSPG